MKLNQALMPYRSSLLFASIVASMVSFLLIRSRILFEPLSTPIPSILIPASLMSWKSESSRELR